MADVRKRSALKGSLTRLKATVDALDENTVDMPTITVLMARVQKLEGEIGAVHDRLMDAAADDIEADAHQADQDATQVRLDEVAIALTLLEEKYKQRNQPPIPPQNQQASKIDYHLPKMELPTFNGDVQKWQSYFDLFTSMVHKNPALQPAQKLQYLKLSLKGEAEATLASVEVTGANYDGALDLLKARFANERVVVFAQLERLMEQPTVRHGVSCSLRKLVDTTNETIRALENLKQDTKSWSTVLVYTLLKKLDDETRERWELQQNSMQVPTFEDLMKFLTQQALAQDTVAAAKNKAKNIPDLKPKPSDGKAAKAHHTTAVDANCPCCRGKHTLYRCEEFTRKSLIDRQRVAKESNLCFNCLKAGHGAANCTSSNCRKCGRKHNTLLHPETQEGANQDQPQVKAHTAQSNDPASVLLGTAIVQVIDGFNCNQECRVLLDSGWQASFISSSCVKRLALKRFTANISISGIASVPTAPPSGRVNLKVRSLNSSKEVEVEALILKQVTGDLPSVTCKSNSWNHLNNLKLADPQFNKPRKVDIILGSDILPQIKLGNIRLGAADEPMAEETIFGYVVSGPTSCRPTTSIVAHLAQCKLDSSLEKFWNLEEVHEERKLTAEERKCEEHYANTCVRNSDGSFTVMLPFKADPKLQLGESKSHALRRFHQLERRLDSNMNLKNQYAAFMQEFLELGHIEEVPSEQIEKSAGEAFYLPHHGVIKESSSTTKLRVVFDGSAKTTSGVSLNEILMVGPTLQEDLFSILVRFRSYQVPMVADLKQMFRHIWLDPQHRDYFRILWRFDKSHPIKVYRSKTVLYGSACATYQATKTLQRLAEDESCNHPLAAEKITKDFYVDDLMSGAASVEAALNLQQDLLDIMPKGNFLLRKWSSSYDELLSNLDPSMRETQLPLKIEEDDSIKALGLRWAPATDSFSFDVTKFTPLKLTKRNILSDLAKVFDPLGLLAAVTITGKIFMQSLWKIKTDWDAELPNYAKTEWVEYRDELHALQALKIPRFVLTPEGITHELLGFSDASEKAFGALVYVRTVTVEGKVTCNLIAAKTKVAPLRQISLPRLELCAAVLLTRLMIVVGKALPIQFTRKLCWTDSTVVRDWIHSPPQRWKTFIANRVTTIQDEFQPEQWQHIMGPLNPADAASRGISAQELHGNQLWWHGPPFLRQVDYSEEIRPKQPVQIELVHEERKVVVHHSVCRNRTIQAYSQLRLLKRHTAIWIKFIAYLKKEPTEQLREPLRVEQLDQALHYWIRVVQKEEYPKEIAALKAKETISPKSSILSLAPFLDEAGLLRVGGRLRNAALPYERKFPLLLPTHHHLTKLVIRYVHEQQFHSGNQLTLYTLQQRYWIPRGKAAVRAIIKSCIRCFRLSQHDNNQLMGNLPEARLLPSTPFHRTGIDYGGPFTVRLMKGRSSKTFKAYMALFICFATRAVHLELVSDLTSEAFLAALKRFVARRSCPSEIRSDNGTNFVGADRELKEFVNLVNSDTTRKVASPFLQEKGINWVFNPPAAPHMGGFWEAGIKSAKFHLKRVMGNASFTYEELETVLVQVEACLNSRPLCPNTADPNEFAALTPGHFLVGTPLNAVPEPSYLDLKENRLSRWQLTQQRVQHFWRRWSAEYLTRLQQRPKWLSKQKNLAIGDIVLLKDDQLPPQKWKLGIIEDVHPGEDGAVRVVTLRTQEGSYKRPIAKVSLLPFEAQEVTATTLPFVDTNPTPSDGPTVRNKVSRSAGNVRAKALPPTHQLAVPGSHTSTNLHIAEEDRCAANKGMLPSSSQTGRVPAALKGAKIPPRTVESTVNCSRRRKF